jgi:hypothetical protein
MQKGIFSKAYSPVLYLFIGLSSLFFALRYVMSRSGIDFRVLQFGNLLVFLVCLLSLRMSIKGLGHQNVQVFLRLVYGSFILKFFVLATGAFLYIFICKKDINKPALFGCIGLYFIYTFFELRAVMKQRKNSNA